MRDELQDTHILAKGEVLQEEVMRVSKQLLLRVEVREDRDRAKEGACRALPGPSPEVTCVTQN